MKHGQQKGITDMVAGPEISETAAMYNVYIRIHKAVLQLVEYFEDPVCL